jgi:hypothetical protein
MKISLIIIEPSTGLYNVAADDEESGTCLSGGNMLFFRRINGQKLD